MNEVVDKVQSKYSKNIAKKKDKKMSDISTPTFLRDGKDIDKYLA